MDTQTTFQECKGFSTSPYSDDKTSVIEVCYLEALNTVFYYCFHDTEVVRGSTSNTIGIWICRPKKQKQQL